MSRANGLTRQEILGAIKRSGSMTAEELSRLLGISQVAVRQHLSSLEAEDAVTIRVERRGLGRPAHRYLLTRTGDEAFPRSYDRLAVGLLEELRSWQGEGAVQTLLARRRANVARSLENALSGDTLGKRVHSLSEQLSTAGYMAEVEDTGEDGFLLVKRNCAIQAVSRSYPDACCAAEAASYSQMLDGAEVELKSSINEGATACTFCIRARSVSAPPVPVTPGAHAAHEIAAS